MEPQDRALASAALSTAAQLGTAIGVAVVVTLAAAITARTTPIAGHHVRRGAATAIALVGLAVAVRSGAATATRSAEDLAAPRSR